ncbi:uncharacterized protein [Elaeis guineensis]|uniref:Uncharacterized protein LOC105045745 n=1 Tax=Elaeis guineensis var. tenera TaxID=51953 RepID=A0A6I9RFE5_ELAGV|nr:uncharacterized protein LOC105045745 [Elaeis guineensis]
MREMDYRFPRSVRSRGREKAFCAGGGTVRRMMVGLYSKTNGYDLGSLGRGHGEGYEQLKGQRNAVCRAADSTCGSVSRREENSFSRELRQNSYRKVSGRPNKAIMNEEMFKETDTKRTSPSVIARLMGLDELPPPKVVDKHKKEIGGCLLKASHTTGSQEKYVPYVDRSLQTNTPELQGVKDVFEVMETSKVEKDKDEFFHKGVPRMKLETDVTFNRQKFMDTMFLSTGETLRSSKEFNDASENFDTSRASFLKYHQEPNSLCTKHLHDLKCFPSSSHANRITLLKSSNTTKYETHEVCSSRKPTPGLLSHSFKEYNGSHSYKLPRLQYVGKNYICPHPSQIVVLKPSLEKAWNTGKTVSLPRASENFQLDFRSHREFGRPGFRESYREGRVWHNFFDNVDALGTKKKSSREIARDVTIEMRQSGSSDTKRASTLRLNGHIRDESSCIMPGMSNLHNSVAFRRSFDHSNEWNSSYSNSSTYSAEYSVSGEARRHLSKQCKLSNQFKEVEHVARDMSTLGEMLALSDEERPMTIWDLQSIHKVSDEKLARAEVPKTRGFPSGISSMDGWNDGYFINLPRSSSLSGSSKVHEALNPCSKRDRSSGGGGDCYILNDVLGLGPNVSLNGKSNLDGSPLCRYAKFDTKSQYLNSGGEEKLPVWDIHVNPEDMRKKAHTKFPAEVRPKVPDISYDTRADVGILTDNFSVPQNMDSKIPRASVQQRTRNILLREDGDSSGNDQNGLAIEEASLDCPQVDFHPMHSDDTESGSSVSSKEVVQPSPVSVLEPPSEEKSSLGCFKRLDADLKDLQMQLQFLQLESTDAHADGSGLLVSGNEDVSRDSHSLEETADILQEFRDEEERDYSYLLDILIDSGVHAVKQDRLVNSCYSPEYPVDPGMFEKLEQKYNKLTTWSKSERKLFFDLINSILAEILAPCMDLRPWVQSNGKIGPMWGCEGLVEKAWQMSVKQQKELNMGSPEEKVLDFKWSESGDDVDIIGREIERMLKEDLLEELVSEFILR